MFGQEKHSTAKTRIVGSIESLILISDWHPRSVHFPPDTEGWDAELISPAYDRRNRLHTNGDVPLIRWREDVFEPARRSERMSWMFLGAATSLAYELGIFDSASASISLLGPRYHRAASLLYIYVTQMAVKMGCSSLLPDNIALASTQSAQDIDAHWTASIRLWTELTRLMKTASAMFFQSMASTKQQLGSGQYIILLQHFAPSLDRWHEQFTASSGTFPPILNLSPLHSNDYRHPPKSRLPHPNRIPLPPNMHKRPLHPSRRRTRRRPFLSASQRNRRRGIMHPPTRPHIHPQCRHRKQERSRDCHVYGCRGPPAIRTAPSARLYNLLFYFPTQGD
jgi:hypothetical protein